MSEYDDDLDDDNTDADNGPAGLRKALKAEKAARAARDKELTELKAQFAELSKASRSTSLEKALVAVGGSAASKIAKFYPSDAEVTPESVKSWLDENKDTFNLGEVAATSTEAAVREEIDPAVQAYLDARERTAELETDAVETPGDEKLIAAVMEASRNAKTMTDYTDAIKALGAPVANTGYRKG